MEGAREQFNEEPKGDEHMEKFEYSNKNILTILKTWFIRSRSYNALQLQQEQFENV